MYSSVLMMGSAGVVRWLSFRDSNRFRGPCSPGIDGRGEASSARDRAPLCLSEPMDRFLRRIASGLFPAGVHLDSNLEKEYLLVSAPLASSRCGPFREGVLATMGSALTNLEGVELRATRPFAILTSFGGPWVPGRQ